MANYLNLFVCIIYIMGKNVSISGKFLGALILLGLLIEYVLPMAGVRGFGNISVILYLIVAIYLLFS